MACAEAGILPVIALRWLTCLITVASSNLFGIFWPFDLMHRIKNGFACEGMERIGSMVNQRLVLNESVAVQLIPDSEYPSGRWVSFGIVQSPLAAACASSPWWHWWDSDRPSMSSPTADFSSLSSADHGVEMICFSWSYSNGERCKMTLLFHMTNIGKYGKEQEEVLWIISKEEYTFIIIIKYRVVWNVTFGSVNVLIVHVRKYQLIVTIKYN